MYLSSAGGDVGVGDGGGDANDSLLERRMRGVALIHDAWMMASYIPVMLE